MKEIGGNSVYLILTDPPYNLSHYPTGIAALETERRFLGFEIDENYFEAVAARLENYQPMLPFLLKPPLGETRGIKVFFW